MNVLVCAFGLGCLLGWCAFAFAMQVLSRQAVKRELAAVMLVSGIVCSLIVYRFGVSAWSLRALLLWTGLAFASLTDLYDWVIPDRIQVYGCIVFLVTAFALPNPYQRIIFGIGRGLLLSGSMLGVSYVFDRATGRESLGGGDIKLFFMTGLYLESVWELLFYQILSCIFGLFTAAVRRQERLPFGPSIAAACMVMLLYGDVLTGWYTGFVNGVIV